MTGHTLSSLRSRKRGATERSHRYCPFCQARSNRQGRSAVFLATAEASFLIVLTGRDVLGFMKTVRVLGLSMPPARLARVDVVI